VQLFDIGVHHLDGSVRVELSGEVDVLASVPLAEALRGLAYRYDADQATIDCSRLTFIDMSTIGQLVGLGARLAGPGRPVLEGVPPFLVRILSITRVLDQFTISIREPAEAASI
jgi:anti-anti-sigma factor